jgi:hypothetical protein
VVAVWLPTPRRAHSVGCGVENGNKRSSAREVNGTAEGDRINWLLSRCVGLTVVWGAVLMMSVLERARAASPETLHLDVFIGAGR